MEESLEQGINPKYTKRISIHQAISNRGKSKFFILHKKSILHKASISSVPKKYRLRYNFNSAERAALHLLKNYKKYFLD